MNALVGGLLGAMFGLGVILTFAGWYGLVVLPESMRDTQIEWQGMWRKLGLAAAGFVVGWVISGWPAAGILGAAIGFTVPLLADARAAKAEHEAKIEALASWAEMLRDTMASHAGLRQAIVTTAEVAPRAIRPEVQRLAQRSDHGALSDALRLFAAELEHAVSDFIVAALLVAAEGKARDLPELLTAIAGQTRQQASSQLRIETIRSRTYAEARSLVLITLTAAVGLSVFSPQFMAPYDTPVGQCVLGGVCGMFAGALWMLVSLSKPEEMPRFFASVADLELVDAENRP